MTGSEKLSQLSAAWEYVDGVFDLQAAGMVIFPADLRRVSLSFQTIGPDAVLLAFRPVNNTQGAIFIWPEQRPTILSFRDYGPLVQKEIFAAPFGTAGNSTLQGFAVYKNG